MGNKLSLKFSGWFIKDFGAFKERLEVVAEYKKIHHGFDSPEEDIAAIIATAIVSSKDISRTLLRSIALQVLLSKDFSIPKDHHELLSAIRKSIDKSNGHFKEYVFFTGIICNGILPFNRIKTPNSIITVTSIETQKKKSVIKFVNAQSDLLKKGVLGDPQFTAGSHIHITKVFIKARSVNEAFALGQKEFNGVLGLLNLSINVVKFSSWSLHNNIPKRVFNNVYALRFGTLHSKNGALASEQITYHKHWTKVTSPKVAYKTVDSPESVRFLVLLSSLRQKHGLSKFAWNTLSAYNDALSHPDYETSFLHLWGVLEQLTSVGAGDSHNKIISRVSFLYSNYNYARLELNHLKSIRNSLVHDGDDLNPRTEEIILFQLNRYVSSILFRVVKNGLMFRNIREFGQFLDSSKEMNDLQTNFRLAEIALKFKTTKKT